MYDAKEISELIGIDFEEAELRIISWLTTQRDRFELAYASEAKVSIDGVRALRHDTTEGFDYSPRMAFMRGAWHGWKLRDRLSGNDPFIGFMLESANAGELAAYDYGCRQCEDAVRRIAEGDDKGGEGVISNEGWAGLRAGLIRMKADAERWRKMLRNSFTAPAFSTVAISIPAFTRDGHDKGMNDWIDGVKE